ncbi:EamA family transporter [Neomegalonema perideroedes]|uniref:EamA family transporter n=1 Tax=Neomegalonema perideroedes TaxID=217219 RepID=UPI00037A13E0|nr:EamA family transporter [Neomegalonema perideroedes]
MTPLSPSAAPQARAAPALAALFALISLQVGAAFAKGLFPLVGPEGVAALRIGMSALLLTLILKPWRLRPDRRRGLALLGYGLTLGLMILLIYRAFAYIPVGIAISIEVLGPLGVALLGSRRRKDFLWIALALLGVALLPFGAEEVGLDWRGVAFALSAALCWGLYVAFGSAVAAEGGRAVAAGMSIAMLFILPLGIHGAGWALLEPKALMIGAAVALMSSALPFLLDIYAMKRLPPRIFGVLMSASPAVSALAGWAVLGERLGGAQWLGICAIAAACAGGALGAAQDSPRTS